MKKYILMSLAALLTISFSSCREEEGTEPGNDPKAVSTIYTYTPELPYNSDNDVQIRIVGNNKVENVYYLAEPAATFDENMKAKGEAGYIDYVIEKGTKAEFNEENLKDSPAADAVITNMLGEYIIAVVSTSASGKSLATTTFVGLEWEDVTDGYYQFAEGSAIASVVGAGAVYTVLQHCTTSGMEDVYRFVDLFGKGYNLKFNVMLNTATETQYGTMWYCRVAPQPVGLNYGNYGGIKVRDIANWQGSDSFATNPNYGFAMYDDYYCTANVQYYVSAGNLGYGGDAFLPMSYFEE